MSRVERYSQDDNNKIDKQSDIKQQKPKKSKKKPILITLLVLILAFVGMQILGNMAESSNKNTWKNDTEKDPADPTKGITLKTVDGNVYFKLEHMYIGQNAVDYLVSIGEDANNYQLDDTDYQFVLCQYKVTIKSGFKDNKFEGPDIAGELYETNLKSKISDFQGSGLWKNADKDITGSDINMAKGDTETLYEMIALPKSTTSYCEKQYDYNGDPYWVKYNVKDF